MARHESEREDLLREATALVERIELVVTLDELGHEEHIVVGFRRGGGASIYFGSDPAFHFNSEGQLRRAFVGDRLLKAERGQLVSMRRVRETGQVQLRSRTFDERETDQLLQQIDRLRRELDERLRAGDVRVVGQVPLDVDVLSRVAQWLIGLNSITIANSPHAR